MIELFITLIRYVYIHYLFKVIINLFSVFFYVVLPTVTRGPLGSQRKSSPRVVSGANRILITKKKPTRSKTSVVTKVTVSDTRVM